ncbi:MAG: argininosuccinate synthase [Methanomicrobiaceae archaeon]|nr:argininosuccinate synthase [Methanomicrobiaceae archaeon]
MKRGIITVIIAIMLVALVSLAGAIPTTEVHLVKYAPDGETVINETTVDIQWMEANLPVYGDGVTHYYHQGPTFNESDPWDPDEFQNVLSRDMGAVKGTNVKDLCDLVGGMEPGDEVTIRASDGFYKKFGYENVYSPEQRHGSIVLCWYNGKESVTGDPQGLGYPPDYYTGMRLVFFADTSTNPWGYHVFGDWDMHETLAPEYRHNFSGIWPSSSGLSVKYVSEIAVVQGEAPVTGGKAALPFWVTLIAAGYVAVIAAARKSS